MSENKAIAPMPNAYWGLTAFAVWGRGVLYVLIAILTELGPYLVSDRPVDWKAALAKIVLAALVTLRAYIDQSPAQQIREPDVQGSVRLPQ